MKRSNRIALACAAIGLQIGVFVLLVLSAAEPTASSPEEVAVLGLMLLGAPALAIPAVIYARFRRVTQGGALLLIAALLVVSLASFLVDNWEQLSR